MNFADMDWLLIGEATVDTLLMTGFSLLFTIIIGLPLGIILFLTSPRQMLANAPIYQVLSFVVNVLRSVPFLILLIVMIPFTRVVAGTSLGVEGAVPRWWSAPPPSLPAWSRTYCASWILAFPRRAARWARIRAKRSCWHCCLRH